MVTRDREEGPELPYPAPSAETLGLTFPGEYDRAPYPPLHDPRSRSVTVETPKLYSFRPSTSEGPLIPKNPKTQGSFPSFRNKVGSNVHLSTPKLRMGGFQ